MGYSYCLHVYIYLWWVEECGKFAEGYYELVEDLVEFVVGSDRCTHTGKEDSVQASNRSKHNNTSQLH